MKSQSRKPSEERRRQGVALVTGASRGIGAAAALALARAGVPVAVNHLPTPAMQEAAEAVAAEIAAAGGRALAVSGDVSDPAAVDEMVGRVRDTLGPIGILINNAALMERGPWTELSVEDWDRMMAVNLRGALLCAQAVYPHMRELGRGKIVNVSSVTCELGRGPYLHYVSSKAGLIGFTRGLAREVGSDNIQVNCVMPGAIRTEGELERFPDHDAVDAELLPLQAIKRRGVPEDLAGAFLFLAGADSDFITGQVLTVDGGWVFR